MEIRRATPEDALDISVLIKSVAHYVTLHPQRLGAEEFLKTIEPNAICDFITARKDYEDRQRRQAQGIAATKKIGTYRGRPANEKLHRQIVGLLADGKSWSTIQDLLGCGRSTIKRVKDMIAAKQDKEQLPLL